MAASVLSSSAVSPLSGFDTDESGESYIVIDDYGGTGSNTGSIGYAESLSSGSLRSFVVVGQQPQLMAPSPPAVSPLGLELGSDAATSISPGRSGESDGFYDYSTASMDANPDQLDLSTSGFNESQAPLDLSLMAAEWPIQYQGQSTFLSTPSPDFLQTNNSGIEYISDFSDLGIPQSMVNMSNVLPWNSTIPQQEYLFLMDENTSGPPSTSAWVSPVLNPAGPVSPQLQQELSIPQASIPSPIRRVRGAVRVEKKRATSSSDSSDLGSSPTSKFVIMTPNTISAHAGKTNPYECLDAMRPSQRGRKGPLANATKENALQVRRRGACFHCHARKVKCDMERPCKNCKKLIADIPQVICWQFGDFRTILFPEFIRGHFENKVLYEFSRDNVKEFKVHGLERPCEVVLSSGPRFATTLRVHAKYFTAKGDDIKHHWHLSVQGDEVQLHNEISAPIGLETVTETPTEELKKKLKKPLGDYFEALIKEPAFAEQVTETLEEKSSIPRNVMHTIHQYFWKQVKQPPEILRRALLICAMHYVMTRQLTVLAPHYSRDMQQFAPPRGTSRLLNRQVKAVIDWLMREEMGGIFDDFSRSLKSKSKKEWAPCMAAFTVLCLFMEAIESATDLFVISENEISFNNTATFSMQRQDVLDINLEIENMPFKQVVFQFHQVFMTHTKDASAKPFNPLVDDEALGSENLDKAARDMALELRNILNTNHEQLEALATDAILPNIEVHPYPSNTGDRYAGHLVSRFLLSFKAERYIFGLRAT